MTAANKGDVEINLDGEPVVLKCTLGAAKEINARFGDFSTAFRRVASFDLAAYAAIIAHGSGLKLSVVEPKLFAAGMVDLTKPVSDYLALLSNGGREADDSKDATTGEG